MVDMFVETSMMTMQTNWFAVIVNWVVLIGWLGGTALLMHR